MSVILCDRCGDGVYLTTETVCLPYVCQACKDAAEIREAAKPATPAKNKRGKSDVKVQTATEVCDKIFNVPTAATLPVEQDDCDCGCGTATVEATTELIEDLNRQLAAEKSLASVLLKSAEVLANDNATYKNLTTDLFNELQAERASATRGQADIARLEQELVTAELSYQKEMEKAFYYSQRVAGERNVLRKQVTDKDEVIRQLNDDLVHSRDERSFLRGDRRFYRELAIERADHPFSNLWKWFKRLF